MKKVAIRSFIKVDIYHHYIYISMKLWKQPSQQEAVSSTRELICWLELCRGEGAGASCAPPAHTSKEAWQARAEACCAPLRARSQGSGDAGSAGQSRGLLCVATRTHTRRRRRRQRGGEPCAPPRARESAARAVSGATRARGRGARGLATPLTLKTLHRLINL